MGDQSATVAVPNDTATAGSGHGLWSEILNSVKNTRGVPTKNILVLGEPSTGKRTLLKALAAGSVSSTFTDIYRDEQDEQITAAAAANTAQTHNQAPELVGTSGIPLLGLVYGYWDVADDDSEGDLLARVGAYTLPSSDPAYCNLLKFAFSAEQNEADVPMRKLYSTLAAQVFPQHKLHHHSNGTAPSANANAAPASGSAAQGTTPSLHSLSKSLIVLVLDWTQPHTFLEQLRRWLSVVRRAVNDASDGGLDRGKGANAQTGWSAKWAMLDEMREHLEHVFTSYREPQGADSSRFNAPVSSAVSAVPAGSTADGPSSDSVVSPSSPIRPSSLVALDTHYQAPLGEGTLDADSNWGVEIVVVCTKADMMGKLEVERQFKEEQFDYVQQVLRVVCLKYGAALFYTSSHRPESVSLLRQYLLNRLFNRTSGASASTRFPLATRASTVDRDTVFVPSGWDSYGKIKALRGNDDTFDCAAMARAWEIDMEVELTRRARIVQGTPADDPAIQEVTLRSALLGPEATSQRSAVASFEDIVGDWHAREPPLVNGAKVASPDIQEFLSQLYTLLLKEPDAGSRAVGTGTGSGTAGTEADGRKHKNSSAVEVAHDDFTRRTVVGPLAAASLGTLSKFSAEEADPSAAAAVQPKPKSKEKRDRTRSELDALAAPRPSASAVSPSGGPQRQSEVLHDFFKSLLKDKPSVSASSGKSSRSSRKAPHSSVDVGAPPPAQ